MNILNKLVRGELSLTVTFWIFYILVRLIVNSIFGICYILSLESWIFFISIRFIVKNIFGICYTLFFANRIPATPFLEILLVTSIIDFIIIIMVIIGIFNILRKSNILGHNSINNMFDNFYSYFYSSRCRLIN